MFGAVVGWANKSEMNGSLPGKLNGDEVSSFL